MAPTLEVQNITTFGTIVKEVQKVNVVRQVNKSNSPLTGTFTLAKASSSWTVRKVFNGFWPCMTQNYGFLSQNECAEFALANQRTSYGFFYVSKGGECSVFKLSQPLEHDWNGTSSPCPDIALNPALTDDSTYHVSPPPSNERTIPLSNEASAGDVLNALLLLDVGVESVSRESLGAGKTGEYTWNITFAASAGNVGQLQVYYSALDQDFNDDRPSGHVSISTLKHGNILLGNFTLNFNGSSTSPMSVDVTAIDMELQLKRIIKNVEVSRSSPTFQNGHECGCF